MNDLVIELCPVDQTPLQTREIKGQVMQVCPTCHGMLLSAEQAQNLIDFHHQITPDNHSKAIQIPARNLELDEDNWQAFKANGLQFAKPLSGGAVWIPGSEIQRLVQEETAKAQVVAISEDKKEESNTLYSILDGVTEAFSTPDFWSFISDCGQATIETIPSAASKSVEIAGDVAGSAGEVAGAVASGVADAIGGALSGL